ncbi:MAG: twin-arginine translocase subunit TatC [Poseidonia sp.]
MAVLLDQDLQQPVQVHLNELTWRTTVVFATVSLLTFAWSTMVDDVLNLLLQNLKPCPGECLNVYDPAQWSAVRWLTSLLLAVLSSLPLVAFHVLQFSKPGLLPGEYKALRTWMLAVAMGLVAIAYMLVIHWLPALYDAGFTQHDNAGLAAQYSAIDMLLVAVFCVWATMVVAATWTGLALMGRLGVVNRTTADVWRLRLYGVGSLLLALSTPNHAQPLLLPLLATYWTSSELIGQRWLMAEPLAQGYAVERLDIEGRRQRIALLDCSCEGANAHHGYADVDGCSTVSVEGICTSSSSRTAVLEHLIQAKITDAVITGCNGNPCPKQFKENVDHLGARLHGLNLMALQNHRVANPHPNFDVAVGLHTLPSLFPANARQHNLARLIEEKEYIQAVEVEWQNINHWSTDYLEIDHVLYPRIEENVGREQTNATKVQTLIR